MKNLIVQLRIYKGREAYDSKGKLISESQVLKLRYETLEWANYMKSIKGIGISKVEVVKCLDGNVRIEEGNGVTHPVIDTPQKVSDEVKYCLVAEVKELTADEKVIKLTKEMEEMKALFSVPKKAVITVDPSFTETIVVKAKTSPNTTTTTGGLDIDALKAEYIAKTKELKLGKKKEGLKPHHLWSAQTISEKISELNN